MTNTDMNKVEMNDAMLEQVNGGLIIRPAIYILGVKFLNYCIVYDNDGNAVTQFKTLSEAKKYCRANGYSTEYREVKAFK